MKSVAYVGSGEKTFSIQSVHPVCTSSNKNWKETIIDNYIKNSCVSFKVIK